MRTGNAASDQLQLDVWGETLDGLALARNAGLADHDDAWDLQVALMEHLEGNWNQPDNGLWETRVRAFGGRCVLVGGFSRSRPVTAGNPSQSSRNGGSEDALPRDNQAVSVRMSRWWCPRPVGLGRRCGVLS
ncbi:glycoside hydrolase family 15 protein [Jatrophihabitans sp. DSM 44399]|uniref:Glycoside hydrolase family 15 protein n=1 Tax=Jatrophihabitans lederbergiae TaxID=3075547 RepID=A0ABU2JHU8_9ACTN|nr:glycoside hydrolase family 15 protein [Jatrophihabitans sp. DSM 44399]MDT0264487.1 glycoside hydrolase family 15 protein [Jatrophihabitans sp. DSM 44399]